MLKAVLWDMDGTLIDSEPYWHEVEMGIAREHGGFWSEDIGWTCSGKPVPQVAQRMIDEGTQLSVDEIGRLMIEGVAQKEAERMPWIPGVEDVLRSLVAAGIPSVLVTASPRRMAENLVRQAPEGAFVGYVCSDDDLPKKPNPAPYLAAAEVIGINVPQEIAVANGMPVSGSGRPGLQLGDGEPSQQSGDSESSRQNSGNQSGQQVSDGKSDKKVSDDKIDGISEHADFCRDMARCVAIEDSMTGIQSAAASGATTIAQTGFIKTDTSAGPQFASINGYDGLTAEVLERYAEQRLAAMSQMK